MATTLFTTYESMTNFGWTLSGSNLKINEKTGEGLCTSKFHAYAAGEYESATIRIVFDEPNDIELTFGNCWDDGYVSVFLKNIQVATATPETFETIEFQVQPGDILEVKEHDGNAIIEIEKITMCGILLFSIEVDKQSSI